MSKKGHSVYLGPPIDDFELTARLPHSLREYLSSTNGYVAYHGGFHVRGACLAPAWHSLRTVWLGDFALHRLYPAIQADDIPFGQDAFGTQYVLRDALVHRLWAETGELESMEVDLVTFDQQVRNNPINYLSLGRLEDFRASGGDLEPGYLFHVYPPLCSKESEAGVSLRPVPALELIGWLASLAQQLRDVPDGGRVRLVVRNPPAEQTHQPEPAQPS